MQTRTVTAMIRSLKATDEVTIIGENDPNNVIAKYKGKRFTAIRNCFNNTYYVDDVDDGEDV